MKIHLPLAIMAISMLAACATPPASIKASTAIGCQPGDQQRLAELSAVQQATANNDAVGVLLIGIPMGSVAGDDHKAEIARLKACVGE